jgi:hypothetical protein
MPLRLPADASEPVKKRITAWPMKMNEVAMMDASGVPSRAVRSPPTRGVQVLFSLTGGVIRSACCMTPDEHEDLVRSAERTYERAASNKLNCELEAPISREIRDLIGPSR